MRADRCAFPTDLRLNKVVVALAARVRFYRAEPPLVRGSEPTSKFLHAPSPQPGSHVVIFSALFWGRLNARDVVALSLRTSMLAQIAWAVSVTSGSLVNASVGI